MSLPCRKDTRLTRWVAVRRRPSLSRSDMATDPFALFDEWFAEARASEINDPEAMALATADADGRPSVRMVLFKGHGPDGFVFYTNEQSAKGEQLARESARRAAVSLEVAAPAGPDRRAGRARSATPKRTPISRAAAAIRSSAPGLRTSRGRSTAARRSSSGSTK